MKRLALRKALESFGARDEAKCEERAPFGLAQGKKLRRFVRRKRKSAGWKPFQDKPALQNGWTTMCERVGWPVESAKR